MAPLDCLVRPDREADDDLSAPGPDAIIGGPAGEAPRLAVYE